MDKTAHWHVSRKNPTNHKHEKSGFDGDLIEHALVAELRGARNPRRTAVIASAVAITLGLTLAGRRDHYRDVVLYRLSKLARRGIISQSEDHKGRAAWAWP